MGQTGVRQLASQITSLMLKKMLMDGNYACLGRGMMYRACVAVICTRLGQTDGNRSGLSLASNLLADAAVGGSAGWAGAARTVPALFRQVFNPAGCGAVGICPLTMQSMQI